MKLDPARIERLADEMDSPEINDDQAAAVVSILVPRSGEKDFSPPPKKMQQSIASASSRH